jgi:hypothetical protein
MIYSLIFGIKLHLLEKMQMPDLSFNVLGAKAVPHSVSPLIALNVGIKNSTDEAIHTIVLRCQVQIEPARRHYKGSDHERLFDLFGEPEGWGQTLRSLLWTQANIVVPPFSGDAIVDLMLPCTWDFNIAVAKYFNGLKDGVVPISLLFSGTIFFPDEEGALKISQIPWSKEANYDLPVQVWKEMMELYYPNTAWLNLRKDVFDQLNQFKVRNGLPTWEEVILKILSAEKGSEV